MQRGNRPSILQIGRVHDDGRTVIVTGWGLGLCTAGCICHRHPTLGHLTVLTDLTTGDVGLVSHRPDPCTCCQPWTIDELAAILRDLADVAHLETTG